VPGGTRRSPAENHTCIRLGAIGISPELGVAVQPLGLVLSSLIVNQLMVAASM
jgi:hypothetical protein